MRKIIKTFIVSVTILISACFLLLCVEASSSYIQRYDLYMGEYIDLYDLASLEYCSDVSYELTSSGVVTITDDYKAIGIQPGNVTVRLFCTSGGSTYIDEYILTVKLKNGVYRLSQNDTSSYLSVSENLILANTELMYEPYSNIGQDMLNQLWEFEMNSDESYTIRPYYNNGAILICNAGRVYAHESKEEYLNGYEDNLASKWVVNDNCSISLWTDDENSEKTYINSETITGVESDNVVNNIWKFEMVSSPVSGIYISDIKNDIMGSIEKRYISKGSEKSLTDLRIQATYYTMNTSTSGLIWSSSNQNVATVDSSSGAVTGVNPGNTIITCSININGSTYSKSYQLEVLPIEDGLYKLTNYQSGFGIKIYSTSALKATIDSTENLLWYIYSDLDGYYCITLANSKDTRYLYGNWFLGVDEISEEETPYITGTDNISIDKCKWKIAENENVLGSYNIYPKNVLNNSYSLGMGILEVALLELYSSDNEEYEYMWCFSKQAFPTETYLNVYTYYDQEFLAKFNGDYQAMVDYINARYDFVETIFYEEYNLIFNHISIQEYKRSEDLVLNELNENKGLVSDEYIIYGDFYDQVTNGVDAIQELKNVRALFCGYDLISSSGTPIDSYSGKHNSTCFLNCNRDMNRFNYALLHEVAHVIGAPDHYHSLKEDGTCAIGDTCSTCGTGARRRGWGCIMHFDTYNPNEPYCDDCKKDVYMHIYNHHFEN